MNSLVIRLFLIVFITNIYSLKAQQLNLKTCDSLTTQKAINACVFKAYNKSQIQLKKAFNIFIAKLDKKAKSKDTHIAKRTKDLKLFLKDAQVHWTLTRDYNAQARSSFELSPLKADYTYYKSKTLESLDRIKYFETLADSLKLK
jgi:uncharacterized protein YecT (DUF1311 family)